METDQIIAIKRSDHCNKVDQLVIYIETDEERRRSRRDGEYHLMDWEKKRKTENFEKQYRERELERA